MILFYFCLQTFNFLTSIDHFFALLIFHRCYKHHPRGEENQEFGRHRNIFNIDTDMISSLKRVSIA